MLMLVPTRVLRVVLRSDAHGGARRWSLALGNARDAESGAADPDGDADAGVGTGIDAAVGIDSDADAGTGTDVDRDADTDVGSEVDTHADADIGADADVGADAAAAPRRGPGRAGGAAEPWGHGLFCTRQPQGTRTVPAMPFAGGYSCQTSSPRHILPRTL